MPHRTRVRERSFGLTGTATITFNGANAGSQTILPSSVDPWLRDFCDDYVNEVDEENPLSIIHHDKTGLTPINGSAGKNGTGWYINVVNVVPTFQRGAMSHLRQTMISNGVLATEAIAGTNPSKPLVSIPNFLYELKDLPGMIRDIGRIKIQAANLKKGNLGPRSGARETANHYLAAQMGWVPLISDLRKLTRFQASVDKRINVLDRLFNKNEGLHRSYGKPNLAKGRQAKYRYVDSLEDSVILESSWNGPVGLITARRHKLTISEKWASVRWKADHLPDRRFSNKELQSLAQRIVLGKNITPSTIWEAIPWSWLIDWFTNVGTYVSAGSNAIPVHAEPPCIMEHRRTVNTYSRTDVRKTQLVGGEGTAIYDTKTRTIVTPTLTASLPFLNRRQLSILGALAIQRLR